MLRLSSRTKSLCVFLLFFSGIESAYPVNFDFWVPRDLKVYEYELNAEDRRIVHITTDATDGWADVMVAVGPQKEVKFFRLVTSGGHATEFSIGKLREGAVLKTDHGINGEELHTVTLQSDSFDAFSGGILRLTYLVNGVPLFQKFESFELKLERNRADQWTCESNEGVPFNSLFFRSHRVLGQVVGVSAVDESWNREVAYQVQ